MRYLIPMLLLFLSGCATQPSLIEQLNAVGCDFSEYERSEIREKAVCK